MAANGNLPLLIDFTTRLGCARAEMRFAGESRTRPPS